MKRMKVWTAAWEQTRGLTAMLAAASLFAACKGDGARSSDSAAGAMAPDTAAMASTSTPPKADDDMQKVLDQHAALGPKPIETLTPAEARQQPTPTDAVKAVLTKEGKPTTPPPGVTTVDRTIAGAAGQLPARIYTPEGNGPFPVVVYFHGGGFVIADKDVYDGGARALSMNGKAVVISVDYRRAPEAKFPAQHDDAMAAYKWALANAGSIKGDPKRVALAGESAGGNLAVATGVGAVAAGIQKPSAIIAVYPIAQTDTMTPSYVQNAMAKPLNRPMIGWFVKQFTNSPADLTDPRISLVNANLAGLPPVTIINAQIDPLLDDGKMLEDALKRANVPVERKVYDGVSHEFFGMNAVVGKSDDAQKYAGDRLRSAFGN